ncbi:histidinol-phosphatase HisJ [Niallia sp. BSM11]|uniref:histidinol-phosphatase HisJ n=1 Tax=Niallia sp. BSM11 TaxID=3391576 RepID=UPI003984C86F
MYKRDGHIHTPYCPHGTKDGLKEYIKRAIDLGFKEITFTEHAPLPKGFEDAAPTKDSCMTMEQLPSYVEDVLEVKAEFSRELIINLGLEIDYIEGYENGTMEFLLEWGKFLDDSVLSVHFLKNPHGKYDCLDYSPEIFASMIEKYGHVDCIYECYFQTLSKSILADLGPFKPKRIGHMTLVHKFQKQFPPVQDFSLAIKEILHLVKQKELELDYNAAGLFKPLCEETYPPIWAIEEAVRLQIPLIYGSDAHQAKDLGQGQHLLIGNS